MKVKKLQKYTEKKTFGFGFCTMTPPGTSRHLHIDCSPGMAINQNHNITSSASCIYKMTPQKMTMLKIKQVLLNKNIMKKHLEIKSIFIKQKLKHYKHICKSTLKNVSQPEMGMPILPVQGNNGVCQPCVFSFIHK